MPAKVIRYRRRRAAVSRPSIVRRSRFIKRGRKMYSVPRLLNRGVHMFKRLCAQVPIQFQYSATGGPGSTPTLQVVPISVLTQGGAQVLGYTMGSNAQAATANNMTSASGSLFGGVSGSNLPSTKSFGFSVTISLQQAMQHLDFTGLFDRYKIVGYKLDLMWHNNNSTIAGGAIFPTLYYAYDGDDTTVPLYANTLLQQEGCRQKVLSRGGKYSFYCKPRQLISTSTSTAGSTNILTLPAKWNNCADAGVQHFGMKFFIDDIFIGSGTQNLLTLQPTIYLACKDTI